VKLENVGRISIGLLGLGVGFWLLRPGTARAQESGQLASDILGSTDMSYNPTFFGYSLHGGPTAHSVA
jgi:hypothetical protein